MRTARQIPTQELIHRRFFADDKLSEGRSGERKENSDTPVQHASAELLAKENEGKVVIGDRVSVERGHEEDLGLEGARGGVKDRSVRRPLSGASNNSDPDLIFQLVPKKLGEEKQKENDIKDTKDREAEIRLSRLEGLVRKGALSQVNLAAIRKTRGTPDESLATRMSSEKASQPEEEGNEIKKAKKVKRATPYVYMGLVLRGGLHIPIYCSRFHAYRLAEPERSGFFEQKKAIIYEDLCNFLKSLTVDEKQVIKQNVNNIQWYHDEFSRGNVPDDIQKRHEELGFALKYGDDAPHHDNRLYDWYAYGKLSPAEILREILSGRLTHLAKMHLPKVAVAKHLYYFANFENGVLETIQNVCWHQLPVVKAEKFDELGKDRERKEDSEGSEEAEPKKLSQESEEAEPKEQNERPEKAGPKKIIQESEEAEPREENEEPKKAEQVATGV